jgi:PAS domain S-box-containing protein
VPQAGENQGTRQTAREAYEPQSQFFAYAPLSLLILDDHGAVQDCNLAAAQLLGVAKLGLIGTPLSRLVSPAEVNSFRSFLHHSGGGRSDESCEIKFLWPDGKPWDARLESFVFPDRGNTSSGLGLIITNTSVQTKLQLRTKQLSVAVEQSPASIVITDKSGSIQYVNPRFTEVTGYSAEEVIGRNPRVLKGGRKPPEAYKRLWDTILAGKIWTGAFENKKKNGEHYWEEASICPIRDDKGAVTHFLAVKQDITKRKKTETALRHTQTELRKHQAHLEDLVKERTAELAKSNQHLVSEIKVRRDAEEAANSASRAKSEFLATMSHELRTPLNGIIGMTEVLLRSELSSAQQRQAGLVKTSGDILLRLINDILDYSKIEAGKLKLDIAEFDLRNCIDCIGDLMGPQAEQKGLELTVGVSPAVPSAIRGDAGRLQQVLNNLVSNAIKFTEQGHVTVRASVDDETASTVGLRISVTDTGIGIPAEKQDVLFQSFSQVDASHSRRFGGTGLGLAISKQLVEMMDGEIGAISELDRGSTFWFTLTLEKDRNAKTPLKVPTDLRCARVLAVDDNATNREILHEQLTGFQLAHEIAPNAESALALLREASANKNPFSLAIVDMQMPDVDGQQLAQRIKSDPEICDTVLLLLTSTGITGSDEKMKDLGFSAWLSKPIKQSQLLDAITEAFACASCVTQCETDKVDNSPTMAPQLSASSGARVLAAEDNLIGQEVLRQVLTMAGYSFEIAEDGRRAVAMWKSDEFDLILMDCQMPNLDGFQATQEIRRIENEAVGAAFPTQGIPIIALTANALQGDREKCLQAGMDDHIAKPFDPARLIETIESHLAKMEYQK